MLKENVFECGGNVVVGSYDTCGRPQPAFPLDPSLQAGRRLKVSELCVPRFLTLESIFQALIPVQVPLDGVFSPLRPLVQFLQSASNSTSLKSTFAYKNPEIRRLFEFKSNGSSRLKPQYLEPLVSLEDHLYRTIALLFQKLDDAQADNAWTRLFPWQSLGSGDKLPLDMTGMFAALPYATQYRDFQPPNVSAWGRAMEIHRIVHGFRKLSALVTFAVTVYREHVHPTPWVQSLFHAKFRSHWISELANDTTLQITRMGRVGGFVDIESNHALDVMSFFERNHIPFWYCWESRYFKRNDYFPFSPNPADYDVVRGYIMSGIRGRAEYETFERERDERLRLRIERDHQEMERMLAEGDFTQSKMWIPGETFRDFINRHTAVLEDKKASATGKERKELADRELYAEKLRDISRSIRRWTFYQWSFNYGIWTRESIKVSAAREAWKNLDRRPFRWCNPITQQIEFTFDNPDGIQKTTTASYEEEEEDGWPYATTALSPSPPQTQPHPFIGFGTWSPTPPGSPTPPRSPTPEFSDLPPRESPLSPPPLFLDDDPLSTSPPPLFTDEKFLLVKSPAFAKPSPIFLWETSEEDHYQTIMRRFGFPQLPHPTAAATPSCTIGNDYKKWLAITLGFEPTNPRLELLYLYFERFRAVRTASKSPSTTLPQQPLPLPCDMFGEDGSPAESTIQLLIYQLDIEVHRFVGSDNETWYTFQPRDPDRRSCYEWVLAVRSSTSLFVCVRIAHELGQAFHIDSLTYRLLELGIGIKTLTEMPSTCKVIPTHGSLNSTVEDTHHYTAQYRDESWCPSSEEYTLFRNMLSMELKADNDRLGRAALLNGGISWRIAMDVYEGSHSFVLKGPNTSSIIFARYNINGKLYYDDELDVRAHSLLSGQISIPLPLQGREIPPLKKRRKRKRTDAQQTDTIQYRIKRFWPLPGQWTLTRWVGFWTPKLEAMYRQRVDEYNTGRELLNSQDWAAKFPARGGGWMQEVQWIEAWGDHLLLSLASLAHLE